MDYSPPGSSVHGISQARILEQFAISFSKDRPDLAISVTNTDSNLSLLQWHVDSLLLSMQLVGSYNVTNTDSNLSLLQWHADSLLLSMQLVGS